MMTIINRDTKKVFSDTSPIKLLMLIFRQESNRWTLKDFDAEGLGYTTHMNYRQLIHTLCYQIEKTTRFTS